MGYIEKDEGAQHYKLETLGYTSAQLLKSKEAHQSVRVSHESDKIMINKSSLIKTMYVTVSLLSRAAAAANCYYYVRISWCWAAATRAGALATTSATTTANQIALSLRYQFVYRDIEPLTPNGLRTLTWMMQSEKYMASGDWIIGRSGRRVDREGFEVLWRVAADPKSTTMSDAAKIFIEFERDMSPLSASVHAWNQDGCENFKDYKDARIEVKHLREMRARRERDAAEFLEGLEDAKDGSGSGGNNDGDDDALEYATPLRPSSDGLPEGWTVSWQPAANEWYYHNAARGTYQMDRPGAGPAAHAPAGTEFWPAGGGGGGLV